MAKKTATLDQQFEETLRRVRAEFERAGQIHPRFECVTDTESFDVPANWPDRGARAAVCAALRDSFRRRRVSGHPDSVSRCLLLGVKRTSTDRYEMSTSDPMQTSTEPRTSSLPWLC
jgi:hypothetical protein